MFLFVSAIEKTYSYTCDITLNTDFITKYKNFGNNLENISNETVKQFYNDAIDSGFKI